MNESRYHLPASVSVAVLIPDYRGRLLLVQQRKNKQWGPPAGRIEQGENFVMAAQREVLEEVGATVFLQGLLGVYTRPRDDGLGIGCVFSGALQSEPHIVRPDEIATFGWFTYQGVYALLGLGQIYKPEYNRHVFYDWYYSQHYPLSVLKSFWR